MSIRIQNRQRAVQLPTRTIRKRVGQIMTYLGCAEHELSLVFANEILMQTLNRTYRQRDYPTNVLAFPQQPAVPEQHLASLLGDVVVAPAVAAREAAAVGHPVDTYILYLIIHGLLHLLGYDHEGSAQQRRRMEQREREILTYLQHAPVP